MVDKEKKRKGMISGKRRWDNRGWERGYWEDRTARKNLLKYTPMYCYTF